MQRIRAAIVRIDDQRRRAVHNAGALIVDQAEAERAVRQLRADLVRAGDEIRAAAELARAAAEEALADGGAVAAAPYQQAAGGFDSQFAVVERSLAHIDRTGQDTAANVERARELLRRNRASLDDAMREQVQLLVRIERAQREQVIAALQHRRRPG